MVPARKSSGNRDRRAATIAEKLDSEPPEVRIPRASAGYPNRSHSHRTAVASICASAGAAFHTPTYLLMPVARKSATAAAHSPPPGMYAMYHGQAVQHYFTAPR